MFTALASGAVVFPGLFYGLGKILKFTFPHWDDADVVTVSERIVSAIHGTISTVTGIIVVSSCKNVMTDSHWLVSEFILFGASYMTTDLFAMYLSHYHIQRLRSQSSLYNSHSRKTIKAFLSKDWLLVFHHLALVLFFLPIALFFRRGLGDFFFGCFFITELSTPFLSVGKILIQLGLNNTRLHSINGILVLLTFFTCRILIFPFMYWMYGRHVGIPLRNVPFHLPWHCNAGNLTIFTPQVYWFYLLLKKAKRLYNRHGKEN
ncbi:TLC domain-containing protein 3A-like isoform X2 [Phyllopteryx taeniolatus]|uniref:TLC domain-containing protein 3A-like isoform X2 n=1 Tax=Phyllopteryx taeniolatus TaxID=161469 RepID=UPI002AD395D9|nr:TLC domain-containing protein 3A-like isoform X2 [Phyllopteryx taeniolatus]